jgi:hypothetical protein
MFLVVGSANRLQRIRKVMRFFFFFFGWFPYIVVKEISFFTNSWITAHCCSLVFNLTSLLFLSTIIMADFTMEQFNKEWRADVHQMVANNANRTRFLLVLIQYDKTTYLPRPF